MPYATGTANNATELRTAMTNLATANGWTWDATNEMLYKAPVYGKLTISGLKLFVQSALGYSGATLTTPPAVGAGISDNLSGSSIAVLAYPVTYRVFLHANPDMIVLSVNYGTTWWQWLMFGNGRALGDEANPVWQWGSTSSDTPSNTAITISAISTPPAAASGAGTRAGGAPFVLSRGSNLPNSVRNSAIYANIEGSGWRYNLRYSSLTDPDNADASAAFVPLLSTQPNAWNLEAQLIRLQPVVGRASSFWSYAADLEHIRITRNDNYSDGQIVTVGSEKWFIAPCLRKNSVDRDMSSASAAMTTGSHSGTIALAIRYDGP